MRNFLCAAVIASLLPLTAIADTTDSKLTVLKPRGQEATKNKVVKRKPPKTVPVPASSVPASPSTVPATAAPK